MPPTACAEFTEVDTLVRCLAKHASTLPYILLEQSQVIELFSSDSEAGTCTPVKKLKYKLLENMPKKR